MYGDASSLLLTCGQRGPDVEPLAWVGEHGRQRLDGRQVGGALEVLLRVEGEAAGGGQAQRGQGLGVATVRCGIGVGGAAGERVTEDVLALVEAERVQGTAGACGARV